MPSDATRPTYAVSLDEAAAVPTPELPTPRGTHVGSSSRTATVTLIAAIASNNVIGHHGAIPWQLPGEQARFKALTMGHALVMGRLTYESIGRPLPGRMTVVVSRQPGWCVGDDHARSVLVATSVDEALALAAGLDSSVFIAGGAQLYAAALPAADVLELTWVHADAAGDTFFPDVDWSHWQETAREEHDGWSAVRYERC